jgi:solute carrier family 26 protein
MLWQVNDIRRYYRESKLDALVWIGTFVTVVVVDIDIGLLAGVVLSLFALYMKGFKSYSCMVGRVDGTEIYVDLRSHGLVRELTGVRIFRHFGSVNFATCAGFKRSLCEQLQVDCHVVKAASVCSKEEARAMSNGMRTLVIDLGAVAHVDVRGYRTLLEVRNELKAMDVRVMLAGASDVVYDSIERAVRLGEGEMDVFPTVYDAVLFCEKKN